MGGNPFDFVALPVALIVGFCLTLPPIPKSLRPLFENPSRAILSGPEVEAMSTSGADDPEYAAVIATLNPPPFWRPFILTSLALAKFAVWLAIGVYCLAIDSSNLFGGISRIVIFSDLAVYCALPNAVAQSNSPVRLVLALRGLHCIRRHEPRRNATAIAYTGGHW
jgi:hypothetical protein